MVYQPDQSHQSEGRGDWTDRISRSHETAGSIYLSTEWKLGIDPEDDAWRASRFIRLRGNLKTKVIIY